MLVSTNQGIASADIEVPSTEITCAVSCPTNGTRVRPAVGVAPTASLVGGAVATGPPAGGAGGRGSVDMVGLRSGQRLVRQQLELEDRADGAGARVRVTGFAEVAADRGVDLLGEGAGLLGAQP